MIGGLAQSYARNQLCSHLGSAAETEPVILSLVIPLYSNMKPQRRLPTVSAQCSFASDGDESPTLPAMLHPPPLPQPPPPAEQTAITSSPMPSATQTEFGIAISSSLQRFSPTPRLSFSCHDDERAITGRKYRYRRAVSVWDRRYWITTLNAGEWTWENLRVTRIKEALDFWGRDPRKIVSDTDPEANDRTELQESSASQLMRQPEPLVPQASLMQETSLPKLQTHHIGVSRSQHSGSLSDMEWRRIVQQHDERYSLEWWPIDTEWIFYDV